MKSFNTQAGRHSFWNRWPSFTILLLAFFGFGQIGHGQYCTTVNFTTSVEPICQVTFAGISNTSCAALECDGALVDYTAGTPATVVEGSTYPITVTGNTGGSWTNFITVFFDWDQDEVFEDFVELGSFIDETCPTGAGISGNVTVPLGAVAGNTRMRVVKNYSSSPTDPCAEYSYGQAEDYTVNVTELSCTPPTVSENITEDCGASTFDLTIDIAADGDAADYDVSYDDGGGSVSVGTYTGGTTGISIGTFAFGTSVDVTVAHNGDATCDQTLSGLTFASCPPGSDCGPYSSSPGTTITTVGNVTYTDDIVIGAQPAGTVLSDLRVFADITHSWISDIQISLESPSGTVVDLIAATGVCGSQDNILIEFDDAAPLAVGAECTGGINGFYQPSGSLSDFDGEPLEGTWTMTVIDDTGGDGGTWNSWCLIPSTFILVCDAPTVSETITEDCNASTFDLSIDIGNDGDATDYDVSYDDGGGSTPVGTYTGGTTGISIGTFALGTNVDVTVEHNQDSNCNQVLSNLTFLEESCPLSNPSACGLNIAIPDNGCGGGNYLEMNITASSPFSALGTDVTLESVDIVVSHSWNSDLEIRLVSPNGVEVLLQDDNGGSADGLGSADCLTPLTYQEGGAALSTMTGDNVSGTFQPIESLIGFDDGSDPNGNWQIRICDDAGGDTGALEYIALNFAELTCVAPTLTHTITEDCGANTFDVSVNIGIDGDGTDYEVSYTVNDGSPVAVAGGPFGPGADVDLGASFNFGDVIDVTVQYVGDVSCDQTIENLSFSADDCPVSNPSACGLAFDIPDNGCGADNYRETNIAVTGLNTVLGTDVQLQSVDIVVSHTWNSDLEIRLVSPNGVEVLLQDDNGGSADGLGSADCLTPLTYQEGGAALSTMTGDNVSGTFQPIESLIGFDDGSDPNGNWQIRICDDAGGDTGALEYVALNFVDCIAPIATASVSPDCANGQFFIDIDVSSLGSASSVQIVSNINGNEGAPITSLPASPVQVGPFGSGVSVELTLTHDVNPDCDVALAPISFICPPINNECGSATTLTVQTPGNCAGNEVAGTTEEATFNGAANPPCADVAGLIDVFYTFNSGSNSTIQWEITLGTMTALAVEIQDVCDGTTIACADGGTGGVVEVTPNTDYILRLVSNATVGGTFDICVFEGPDNPLDECEPEFSVSPGSVISNGVTTTSTITVGPQGAATFLTDLNVVVDITHPWTQDLTMTLTSPCGTEITLIENQPECAAEANMVALFDDEATDNTAAWCDYRYGPVIPADALSAFDDENVEGDWVLTITDFEPLDDGVLNQWCLVPTLDEVCVAPEVEVTAFTDQTITVDLIENSCFPSGNYTSFDVSWDGGGDNGQALGVTLPFQIPGLTPGTEYVIDVSGNCASGSSTSFGVSQFTLGCAPGDLCTYDLTLSNSSGTGFGGATVSINNGWTTTNYTLDPDVASDTWEILACPGLPIVLSVSGAPTPIGNNYTINLANSSAITVFEESNPDNNTAEFIADGCPDCAAVNNIQFTRLAADLVELSWNNIEVTPNVDEILVEVFDGGFSVIGSAILPAGSTSASIVLDASYPGEAVFVQISTTCTNEGVAATQAFPTLPDCDAVDQCEYAFDLASTSDGWGNYSLSAIFGGLSPINVALETGASGTQSVFACAGETFSLESNLPSAPGGCVVENPDNFSPWGDLSCGGALSIGTSWTGEYSEVTVAPGSTYTFFSPDQPGYFVTITDESDNILAAGSGSVEWVPNFSGTVRFWTHLDDECGFANISHTRAISCTPGGTPALSCDAPTFSLTFNPSGDNLSLISSTDFCDFSDGEEIYNSTTCPTCFPASSLDVDNITVSSADISWQSTNPAGTNVTVYVGLPGFTPGVDEVASEAFVTTGTNPEGPVTVGGLNGETAYQAIVVEDCSGDPADPSSPISFTTATPGITCSTAIPVDCNSGVISGNTTGIPNDNGTSGAPGCEFTVGTGGQIWYAFTPAINNAATLSLCGSGFDTKIHVYTGSCGTLSCVTSNDDFCGLQSEVTFNALAGETYLVRVGGFTTSEGAFDLTIACGPEINCFSPSVSANVVCSGGGFDVLVDIGDEGTAANYNVSYTVDDGASVSAGSFTAGSTGNNLGATFNFGESIDITVEDPGFPGECAVEIEDVTIIEANCPPPNDFCSGAIPIDPSPQGTGCGIFNFAIPFSSDGTTDSGVSTACSDPGLDQWFTWTATSTALIWNDGTGNPGISIFADCGDGAAGNAIACENTFAGTDAVLSGWSIGDPLIIHIHDFDGSVADISFCLEEFTLPLPPDNDDCGGAFSLTPNVNCSPVPGTIEGATDSGIADLLCDGFTGTPNDDVWYSFTADGYSSTVTLDANFDAVLDIRTGACGGTNVACADGNFGSGIEEVTFPTNIGETYLVRLNSWGSTTVADGGFTICVESTPPPANDECGNAQVLTPVTYPATSNALGSLAGASADGASACVGINGPDAFYTFNVSLENHYWVNVNPIGGFNPVIEVLDACDGTVVGCGNTESLFMQNLVAGDYIVRVHDFNGSELQGSNGSFLIGVQSFPFAGVQDNPNNILYACNQGGFQLEDFVGATPQSGQGALDYQWYIYEEGGTFSNEWQRGESNYVSRCTWLGMAYGTTYNVYVRILLNIPGEGLVWGVYPYLDSDPHAVGASSCTISTASDVTPTELRPNYTPTNANGDLYSLCDFAIAYNVSNSENFRWRFDTDIDPNSGNEIYYTRGSGNPSVRLSWVNGLVPGVDYNVAVEVMVDGQWSGFSTVLPINLALPPNNVVIRPQFCGGTYSPNGYIMSQSVCEAELYQFRFTPAGGGTPSYRNSGNYVCFMSAANPALTPGDYDVQVKVTQNGVPGDWGPPCTITISGPQGQEGDETPVLRDIASTSTATLFPNPNAGGEVRVELSGLGDGNHEVNVNIYDVYGKLISTDGFGHEGSEMSRLIRFNEDLATGMYMVHVFVDGEQFTVERLVVK